MTDALKEDLKLHSHVPGDDFAKSQGGPGFMAAAIRSTAKGRERSLGRQTSYSYECFFVAGLWLSTVHSQLSTTAEA